MNPRNYIKTENSVFILGIPNNYFILESYFNVPYSSKFQHLELVECTETYMENIFKFHRDRISTIKGISIIIMEKI